MKWGFFVTKQYRAGQFFKLKVTKVRPYGAFVKTVDGVDGLIHISQVMDDVVQNIHHYLSKGQIAKCKIISVNDREGKLHLTLKENEHLQRKSKKKKERSILEIIEETEEYGFESLRERLPIWIKEAKVQMYDC